MFRLDEEYKVISLIATTTVTADLNGTGVDCEQYEADSLVIVNTGLISSTACTYVVNIQGSTALAGAYTTLASFTAITDADDYKIGAIPVNIEGADRKYIRAQVDTTLASGAATISAVLDATILVRPTLAQSGLNNGLFA